MGKRTIQRSRGGWKNRSNMVPCVKSHQCDEKMPKLSWARNRRKKKVIQKNNLLLY